MKWWKEPSKICDRRNILYKSSIMSIVDKFGSYMMCGSNSDIMRTTQTRDKRIMRFYSQCWWLGHCFQGVSIQNINGFSCASVSCFGDLYSMGRVHHSPQEKRHMYFFRYSHGILIHFLKLLKVGKNWLSLRKYSLLLLIVLIKQYSY